MAAVGVACQSYTAAPSITTQKGAGCRDSSSNDSRQLECPNLTLVQYEKAEHWNTVLSAANTETHKKRPQHGLSLHHPVHTYLHRAGFIFVFFYDDTIFQSKQFPFQYIDQNSLLWAPRYLESKLFLSTEGGGAVSSRSFDLLNSMIYDLKRSVDLRWLFDPVLHSSLDDLVCL